MLFPEADWRRDGESDAQFADRTRAMLQKRYLTPLRAAAMLPEVSARPYFLPIPQESAWAVEPHDPAVYVFCVLPNYGEVAAV